jgi:hypothetical protein
MSTLQIGAMREQCFDSATLAALARRQSTVPLRRAGALIELTIVGVAACLAGQPAARTAVLWGSRVGIRAAGGRVITDIVIAREMPFPFDFLATQPIVAAIALQKSFPCIENVLYQPWGEKGSGITGVEMNWQRMRTLAAAWLRAGRCARVLCGQVEPGENAHRGRWQMLESEPNFDLSAAMTAPMAFGPRSGRAAMVSAITVFTVSSLCGTGK